jgi:hypothetical protein
MDQLAMSAEEFSAKFPTQSSVTAPAVKRDQPTGDVVTYTKSEVTKNPALLVSKESIERGTFINQKQAAKTLGVSRQEFARYEKLGIIRGLRGSFRGVYYHHQHVEALAKRLKTSATRQRRERSDTARKLGVWKAVKGLPAKVRVIGGYVGPVSDVER